jgi:hypothetical protein
MNAESTSTHSDDFTSYPVDILQYDTHGLCVNYSLRRHKFEKEANAGCQEARQDWIKYIGPIEQFGGCNPINGNFTAVVLPLCLPERLRLVAYILECEPSLMRVALVRFIIFETRLTHIKMHLYTIMW